MKGAMAKSGNLLNWAALQRGLALAAGISMLSAAPVSAAPSVCISAREIQNQTVENRGKSIVFTMRNGTQWRNTLKGSCPDLIYNGFVWTLRNPGEQVCENEQSLKVLQSGQVCMLGRFQKLAAAKP